VYKHKDNLVKVNPDKKFDFSLRAALTNMMNSDDECQAGKGSAAGLRYLRDRINVPRDMSIYAGRMLRTALESTAAMDSTEQGIRI